MGTKKLYYADCGLRNFTARVISCEKIPEGYAIRLDQTAFYPGGGGQAWDTGTLGGVRVVSMKEVEGEPVHICDGALPVGQTAEGRIHWDNRFDQMQQHTGEHILSGIVHGMFGFQNVGFHVGADTVTVDFDGEISPERLREIEEKANRAVWEDLPVVCDVPDAESLGRLTYRAKRPLPWPVRIVEIPGVDRCACCAVHVARTGQVGMVKILSCVKFHRGVRMEIVCGARAYRLLDRVYRENLQVSQAFSAKMLETGQAAREMNRRLEAEKYRRSAMQARIFDTVAAGYQGDCCHIQKDLLPGEIRELADRIASRCGGTAAVLSDSGEGNCGICIIGEKAGALGKDLRDAFSGRGGGKPGCFQGSIPEESCRIREYIIQWFHKD